MVEWKTGKGDVALSIVELKRLCRAPNATDIELRAFVETCRVHGLNPLLGEVYLIEYEIGKGHSIVLGRQAYQQRAEANPDFLSQSTEGYRRRYRERRHRARRQFLSGGRRETGGRMGHRAANRAWRDG